MAVVVASVTLPAGMVLASHAFTDVAQTNVHHDALGAITEAGVTTGCAPGLYCPADPVRRDQMATFLDRLGALSGQAPVVNASTAETADEAMTAQSATEALTAQSAADAAALEGLSAAQVVPFAVVTHADVSTATSWEPLPGASVSIEIPEGHQGYVLGRFTAESNCWGASGWCSIQSLVNGTPAEPDVGSAFAFDSTFGNTKNAAAWQSHSVERIAGPLPAGTYEVVVERMVTSAAPNFWLAYWTLIAEVKLTG